jgi:predicted nucleic acid-binding protein
MTAGSASTAGSTAQARPTLIDTSLWIEVFRRDGSEPARRAVADVVESGLAVTNGLIVSELLRGARDEQDYLRLQSLLGATTAVSFTSATWQRTARLGFDLRREGLTVPTVDLAIASCALEEGFVLAHRDRHFSLIAAHSPLQERFVAFDA